MNRQSHSRLSCRLVRFWSAIVNNGAKPQGFGSTHVARCADCQRHFAAVQGLEQSLRRAAPAAAVDVPAGLDTRILQEIVRSSAAARQDEAARKPRHFTPILAGAAAALVVALALMQSFDGPSTQPTFSPDSAIEGSPDDHVAAANGVDGPSWSELTAPVASALQKDPLQAEAQRVYADAQTAVRFLALNFLPSSPRAASGQGRPTSEPAKG